MKFMNVIENNKCTGCMACKNICPVNAIKIRANENGFQYPKINKAICKKCGLCEKICPVNKKIKITNQFLEVYCCKNKDDVIRMKSSSGGIFTLIAQHILKQEGVVFGAKFNKKLEVIHDFILKEEDLDIFRGSKYVQSRIGSTYKKAESFLKKGKKVLFTGTPCQIEGLLAYLKKDYDNLYTQDFICHGVPSPKVWKKYLEYKSFDKNIKKVNFRRKDISGWSKFQMNYIYSDSEENIYHADDIYMKLFLKNFDLRDSCYNCSFKNVTKSSDITLADYWGIDKVNPKFNDEKGISVCIINSKKGKEIFEEIKKNIVYEKGNIEDIIKYNSAICKSVPYNEQSKKFFKCLKTDNFQEIIRKFL